LEDERSLQDNIGKSMVVGDKENLEEYGDISDDEFEQLQLMSVEDEAANMESRSMLGKVEYEDGSTEPR
jgi:hypothetical protein